MISRHYVLQYHLYAVALDRYLTWRLPGYERTRHFGGVRYLFIRGIHGDYPEHGIFADCPAPEHIGELADALLAVDWRNP